MRTEQLHKDTWYDKIHANHVCCVFWLFLMLLTLGIALAYCIPVWQFDPATTQCTIVKKDLTKSFSSLGDEMVTFHVFRTEMQVKYVGPQGPVSAKIFGPENQADVNEGHAGFSLSLFEVKNFYNKYQIGGTYKCFYSKKNKFRATFSSDPTWAALFAVPGFCFLVACFVCIYPPLDKLLRNRRKKYEKLELYKELEVMDSNYEKEIFDSDDEGAYNAMVASRGGSLIKKDDAFMVDDDEDDEWMVQEEIIETMGKFFGIEVEDDGQYATESVELLQDVQDDVQAKPDSVPQRSNTVLQRQSSVRAASIRRQQFRSAPVQQEQQILLEMDDIKTDLTEIMNEDEPAVVTGHEGDDDWENQPDEVQPKAPVTEHEDEWQ